MHTQCLCGHLKQFEKVILNNMIELTIGISLAYDAFHYGVDN